MFSEVCEPRPRVILSECEESENLDAIKVFLKGDTPAACRSFTAFRMTIRKMNINLLLQFLSLRAILIMYAKLTQ